MTTTAIPLQVHVLHKKFGKVEALRGVSFVVQPGEVFGYLGPNGAGKTTTLRIALGLVQRTSGVASLFGKSPNDVASRRDVGFIPGDLKLYGDMSGERLLDF